MSGWAQRYAEALDDRDAEAEAAFEAQAELGRLRDQIEAQCRHMVSVPYPLRRDREGVAADILAVLEESRRRA